MNTPGADNQATEEVFEYQPLSTLNKLLRLNQKMWAAYSAHIESRYDISVNDFRLIMMLGQLGEAASHEIAEHTGMPVMSISRAVNALEKQGMVERTIDSNNRRRKPITLSEKGQKLFEKLMPTSNRVAKYVFDSLRIDEILSFDHHLDILTERFTQTDENGELQFVNQTRPPEDELD